MKTDITGVSGSRAAYYAAKIAMRSDKMLLIVSSADVATRLKEDISFFMPKSHAVIALPEKEPFRILYEAKNRDDQIERIKALDALCGDGKALVIAPVTAAMHSLPVPSRFASLEINLKTGDEYSISDLRELLFAAGYENSPVTEAEGEFSVRGGIVDVFSAGADEPVRIEFFGDEIESIRTYDPDSQRVTGTTDETRICAAAEFVPTDEEIAAAVPNIAKDFDGRIDAIKAEYAGEDVKDGRTERLSEIKRDIIASLEEKTGKEIFSDYIKYFDIEKARLWDYLGEKGLCCVLDPARVEDSIPESEDVENFRAVYERNVVFFTPLPTTVEGAGKIDKSFSPRIRQTVRFGGHMELFANELKSLLKGGYEVTIVCSSEERTDGIREYIEEHEIFGKIKYAEGDLSSGFVSEDEKICYITERDIFPRVKNRAKKSRKKKTTIDFSDIKNGDYVVHEEYGIGRFEGIHTETVCGEKRDYLRIQYADTDVLLIPVDQIDMIQKYIGGGKDPKLSSFAGSAWKNTRERAKKAIMKIAKYLVDLYAEREEKGGYAFSKDTVWQREFEDSFPYEETDDQLKAIEEIKADMEKPITMDRLLCGDVGYGKTEVAARAIFKCLAEGRQAVMLAPTTLLVNQHYHTLKERFADFPFYMDMLSRFRTDAEQKETVKKLASGEIDFVVGTHRLLSDDVKFKDLGLLVVDEEQRFGVHHKEKIKMMRKDVDVLTLSATPIPRTLNMSLSGIKDVSMIEEAPGERHPVQTFVTPEDEDLIAEVIRRELSRGGQVFVTHNKIRGIRDVEAMISRLVPEARVAVGHGRMDERELEEMMMDFIAGDTDVLVATTIIENGIDIPNANTMIILDSDRLGLAQLHQLRGRVGRSSRIAYAYLMYKPQKTLTETAKQRLAAIRAFTEFGAGFKIALRDLEIRGSGNVLGEAQHGHIEGIGYELYCKEVGRAVERLRGIENRLEEIDVKIDIDIPAHIPEVYISEETLKLRAYKRIAQIDSEENAKDVIAELVERYGEIPETTYNLIKVALIKVHAARVGIPQMSERGKRIFLEFDKDIHPSMYAIALAQEAFEDAVSVSVSDTVEIRFAYPGTKKTDPLLKLLRAMDLEDGTGLGQKSGSAGKPDGSAGQPDGQPDGEEPVDKTDAKEPGDKTGQSNRVPKMWIAPRSKGK